jgi:hypothetical protein
MIAVSTIFLGQWPAGGATTLLLAKSPSEHITIITDSIEELYFERTSEMLIFDGVELLQDLPLLVKRVEVLANRELLERKSDF